MDESPETASPEDESSRITKIKLGAVARCVERYFRNGDIDSSLELLSATPTAREIARESILSLPVVPARAPANDAPTNSIFTAPARDDRARMDVGPKTIDSKLVRVLLSRVRREKDASARSHANFWQLSLTGADTRDRIVRCCSANELHELISGAQSYLKDQEDGLEPALAVSDQIDDALLASELSGRPVLSAMPIIRMRFSNSDAALLPVAFALRTKRGQRRIATLLLVAAARKVWNQLCS